MLRKVLRPTQHPNRLPRIRIWCSSSPNLSPPATRVRKVKGGEVRARRAIRKRGRRLGKKEIVIEIRKREITMQRKVRESIT